MRRRSAQSPAPSAPPQNGVNTWRTTLPFWISYTSPTGTAVWPAHTPEGALLAYGELRRIGAGAMTIRTERDEAITLEQLWLVATRETSGVEAGDRYVERVVGGLP